MRKALLLFAILILPVGASAGTVSFRQARYQVSLNQTPDQQVMRIKGTILSQKGERDETFLSFLRKRVKPRKDLKIVLDVFGGDLAFVNKIYDVLKSKNSEITTLVERFRYCASACIPLFMVGDVRVAQERTNWGFHQAATMGGYLMIPFMAEYVLRDKGVDPKWLRDNQKMFRRLKMTWLSPEELHGSNILTQGP